jgi:hypothetical protein
MGLRSRPRSTPGVIATAVLRRTAPSCSRFLAVEDNMTATSMRAIATLLLILITPLPLHASAEGQGVIP